VTSLPLLAGLVFLASTAGIVGFYMVFVGRRQAALRDSVGERLLELTGHHLNTPESSLIRTQSAGPLPALDRMAREVGRGLAVEGWLEQSGVRMSISGLMLITLGSGAIAALLATRVAHQWWIALLGFGIGVSIPIIYVRYKRANRLYAFEEHFPEALDLMSRAVRAGHAFSAAMKMVADELGEPIGPEFRKAFEEQNFGMSLKDALSNLTMRVPVLDVRFFATAVLIQKETGGNLSEILDNLAAVVRERFKIRRQVRVHTAHGRFTGYVLLGLPAFLAVSLSYLNPDHMASLFKDPAGHMLIAAGIVMQTIGWIWIKQVVKIEV
jgi:tight adherence protein B